MNAGSHSSTAVTLDADKNRVATLIITFVAIVGISLVVLGVMKKWGFLAIFWSSILALLGVASLVGRMMGGGFAKAPCPQCGEKLSFVHIKEERTLQCESCTEWSTGLERMSLIPDDHVASLAVFSAQVTDHVTWPKDESGATICPVCSCVTTMTEELSAEDVVGSAAAAISPISFQRTHKLKVPVCPDHSDGIILSVSGSELELSFRSYPYTQAFQALNPITDESSAID